MKTNKRGRGNHHNRNNSRSKDDQECSPNKRKKFNQRGRYYHNYFNYFDGNNVIKNSSGEQSREEAYGDNTITGPNTRSNVNFFKRKRKNKILLESRGNAKDVTHPIKKKSASSVNKLCEQSASQAGDSFVNKNVSSKNLIEDLSLFSVTSDQLFNWLLHPVLPISFNANYWEKNPLFVSRNISNHYDELAVTTDTIDKLLRDNHVLFTKNIDITTYTDGVRETHNPVGRALPHIVWDFFRNGCSVRLLNPQTFIHSIYRLNETLQNHFNGFVGANLYLTPPNSQGFAPHYDDIEAFVLQLQGCKYWKIYRPRTKSEELPRYSSCNFTKDEIGDPILEVALKPGDLLYFPRGYIHQAYTKDELSLHITLSAYQCTAYVDLFEKLLPAALSTAAKEHVELRQGLPLDYSTVLGSMNQKSSGAGKRKIYKEKIEELVKKVLNHLDIDSAVDSLVAQRLHDQLPPYFSEGDRQRTVFDNCTKLNKDGKKVDLIQLKLYSRVVLTNPKICRLVKTNDGRNLLYHSINNSMEYHGFDEEYLEVPDESINAFKMLVRSFPRFVMIKNLPIKRNEDKWSFANSLWEMGLLKTNEPLRGIDADFAGNVDGADENEEMEDVNSVEEDNSMERYDSAIENEVYETADNSLNEAPRSKPEEQNIVSHNEDSDIDVGIESVAIQKQWTDISAEDVVIVE